MGRFRPGYGHVLPLGRPHLPQLLVLTSVDGDYTFLIFNCGSGPEHGHEAALELVSGANLGCVLHHGCETVPLERVSGPSSAGERPKTGISKSLFSLLILSDIKFRGVGDGRVNRPTYGHCPHVTFHEGVYSPGRRNQEDVSLVVGYKWVYKGPKQV